MAQTPQATGQDSATDPNARIPTALNNAVKEVPGIGAAGDADANVAADAVAELIAGELDGFLTGHIPEDAQDDEDDRVKKKGDPCKPKTGKVQPKIAPFCAAREREYKKAKTTYSGSKGSAASVLKIARDAWTDAVTDYEFAIATAEGVLSDAQKAATDAYDSKKNDDSGSRSHQLYYAMKEAIAAAVQTFEASAGAAASTLAGAAGALLGAYATYVSAITAAKSQRLVDEATAEQTFWQAVENVWDS